MEQEMQIGYERNLNHTYLVYSGKIDENAYEIQMILHNRIPGILESRLDKVDGRGKLYYEISSKQPLRRIYEKKKMDYASLKALLESVQRAIMMLEEFLLSTEYFAADPELIYVDLEKDEYYFCLLPKASGSDAALARLMEFLLACIDYSDQKAVAAAYECYKKSEEANCSFIQIFYEVFGDREPEVQDEQRTVREMALVKPDMESLQEAAINEEPEEPKGGISKAALAAIGIAVAAVLAAAAAVILNLHRAAMEKLLAAVILAAAAVGYLVYKYRNNSDEEEEDFFFETEPDGAEGESNLQKESPAAYTAPEQAPAHTKESDSTDVVYGETVFFQNRQMEGCRRLESAGRRFPDFTIERFPFVIGKLEDAVDGVLEHETVSRIHCRIEFEEGSYYIMDLNSTNGTVVNGSLLNMNERASLQIGDEIRLGQAVYTFT